MCAHTGFDWEADVWRWFCRERERERKVRNEKMIWAFKGVNRHTHTHKVLIEAIHRVWKLKLLFVLLLGIMGKKHISDFWLAFIFKLIPSNGFVLCQYIPPYSSALVLIPPNEWINNCRGQGGSRADLINTQSDLLHRAYLSSALMEHPVRETCVDFMARCRSPETRRERRRWSERVRKSKRGPWRPRWRVRDVNGVQSFLFRPVSFQPSGPGWRIVEWREIFHSEDVEVFQN